MTSLKVTTFAALVACSLSAASAEAKSTIEFWYGNHGSVEEAILASIDAFNSSQDKFEVIGVRRGNYEETFAAMIAAYRTGQHPTIIQATERAFLTMLNSDAAVPVSTLMTENGYDIDWSSFIAPVADFFVVGDAPAALPFNNSTAILFYNEDHFKAAGFDAPAETWDDFGAQLYEIVEQGGTRTAAWS